MPPNSQKRSKVKNKNDNYRSAPEERADTSGSDSDEDGSMAAGQTATCGKCNKQVTSLGIACNLCDTWFHIGCGNVHRKLFDARQQYNSGNDHWFCDGCRCKFKNLKSDNDRLRQENKTMRDRMNNIEQTVDSLRVEIQNLTQTIGQKNTSVGLDFRASEEAREDIRQEIKELWEKEKKKDNIVIYNIRESTNPNKEDKMGEDFQACNTIINKEVNIRNFEIKEIRRLGPEREDQGSSNGHTGRPSHRASQKPRPLLVRLRNTKEKWEVIKEARKLKNSHNEYVKNIFIVPDLTYRERELEKKLRDELQRKRENGETGWYIRRGALHRNENQGNNPNFQAGEHSAGRDH